VLRITMYSCFRNPIQPGILEPRLAFALISLFAVATRPCSTSRHDDPGQRLSSSHVTSFENLSSVLHSVQPLKT
jgi:hypothetical protein